MAGTTLDDRAIARWRLRNQHLCGPGLASASEVVRWLVGVQAENHAQASWAVATRTTGLSQAEFARAFADGEILRTHVLRPTWHFVHPEDIRWLLELTRPRVVRTFRSLQRELGLDDGTLAAADDVIVRALHDGHHLTRAELGERLGHRGLPGSGRGLVVVVACAELDGLICSGTPSGKDHTYALLDERAPGARVMGRSDALAELAIRYFRGHGPATERDLAYWATLTLADVRAGVAAAGGQLDSFVHDGRTFLVADPVPDARCEPRGHLLQIFDEFYRGYQDSRRVLDADGWVPPGRETSAGMAVVDGQMVGGMVRRIEADRVTFEVTLHRVLDDAALDALHAAAARYGRFLGREPTLILSPHSL